ncbi:MAG: glycerophosphodiester phosphodiesterase family protein [Gammaproteobacteria bacterium]
MSDWTFQGHPAVVAHRGFAGRYPENTVLALAAAVAYGARFLEFDIQLTRDGVPVVCHDETLERCGNDSRSVLDVDWAQLRGTPVGEAARFGNKFAGVTISSLAEVAEHLNLWPSTTSFVEIKEHSTAQFGVRETVAAVLEALTELKRPYVILSFVDEVIPEARRQGAELTGWVIRDWNDASRATLGALNPDYVYCNQDKIRRDEALWPGSWEWVLYEVTQQKDADHWRRAGAAMIESMQQTNFIEKNRESKA